MRWRMIYDGKMEKSDAKLFEKVNGRGAEARALEALLDGKEHSFTAPLVTFVKCKTGSCGDIARALPEDWPMWCNPDYSQVEKEIKGDPR